MSAIITIPRFRRILLRICDQDTSFDPKGWTRKKRFWGHADVVSLLAQSLFQGRIFGVSLKGTKFAKLKFHLWNFLPDKSMEDFTRSQFGRDYPGDSVIGVIEVSMLLANKNTNRRFKLLQERFETECNRGVKPPQDMGTS